VSVFGFYIGLLEVLGLVIVTFWAVVILLLAYDDGRGPRP
jgi:hypothetical protein